MLKFFKNLHLSLRYAHSTKNPLRTILTKSFFKQNTKVPLILSLSIPFFTKSKEINEEKIYNISVEKYKPLHNIIKKYLNDSRYVYKLCSHKDHKWLVILERTPETKTNEGRKGLIDASKAKHRGNVFKVRMIVDIDNPNITTNELSHTFVEDYYDDISGDEFHYSSTVIYKVDHDVKPEHQFVDNLDIVCGSGIHFFTDIFCALSYGQWNPQWGHIRNDGFTGVWKDYDGYGKLLSTHKFVNGNRI